MQASAGAIRGVSKHTWGTAANQHRIISPPVQTRGTSLLICTVGPAHPADAQSNVTQGAEARLNNGQQGWRTASADCHRRGARPTAPRDSPLTSRANSLNYNASFTDPSLVLIGSLFLAPGSAATRLRVWPLRNSVPRVETWANCSVSPLFRLPTQFSALFLHQPTLL